jgi:FkbM family methyltransferase
MGTFNIKRDKILCGFPRFYSWLLCLHRERNLDKLTFLENIKQGQIVFDLGANEGYYTALAGHIVGPTGQVHAFEPVPATFEKLRGRIAAAGLKSSVFLNNQVVGETKGPFSIFLPSQDYEQASLLPHSSGSWARGDFCEIKTTMTNLDHYSRQSKVPKVDFIKIDVEGAEGKALQGGRAFLGTHLPILYLEVCPGWLKDFGASPDSIEQQLRELGYKHFEMRTQSGITTVESFAASFTGTVQSLNFLCRK